LCVDEAKLVVDLRKEAADVEAFDKEIESHINLFTPKPELVYSDINLVWTRFQNMFSSIGGFLSYWPIYREFHYQILQEMYDDNVMYAEFRTGVGGIDDVGGRKIDSRELTQKLNDISDDFKKTHPGFLGFKIIIAINRNSSPKKFEQKLQGFIDLR
jgi:adenosine deaminase CECR1